MVGALALLVAPVAITGGTVHPISGPSIRDGVVLFEGERILAVGSRAEVPVPADYETVDASGLNVWPGLVDAMSRLGLVEIGSVRGTRDHTEAGRLNPNSRAEIAINASSSHLPVTRANGTLLAATVPYGSLVPGTAAAIALDGWTNEELVRRAPVGLVIEWPAMKPEKPAARKEDERPEWEERVARLDEMIEEARTYDLARATGPVYRDADVRWESLRAVVEGEVPVWIQAKDLVQIRAAIDWADEHGLRMILIDGTQSAVGDSWRIAHELAEREIPVILRSVRQPGHRYEPYDTPFTAPGVLHEAGVRVAFGSWNSAHARNLPQEAARAVTFGMPRRAAERSLTLEACEILGIHERYGSLEPDKSATMILVEGDVLDIRMQVVRAWIDGREIDLESRHTRLRDKWSRRPLPDASTARAGE